MKKKIILAAVTFAMAFSAAACSGKEPAVPTEQTAATESTELSIVEFSQIKQGMTVEEVNEVLGFDGTLTADTGQIKTYDWTNGTRKVSITFVDDKADIIAQVGLDTDRGWISK